jgi:hypothetical protein
MPYARREASAIPYAGQTGPRLLLLMLVVACPSLPATKYARNTVVSCTKNADVSTACRGRRSSFRDQRGTLPEPRKCDCTSIVHLTRQWSIFA